MNPELLRNAWLTLSPQRLLMMPLVLGLIGLAVHLTADNFDASALALKEFGEGAYGIIVIIWGTWLAGRSVVGEINDRTWDGQRMSAIRPFSMVVGKLFGATLFTWYGGLMCLGLVFVTTSSISGVGVAISDVLSLLAVGVFGHAVALFASLLAVRRSLAGRSFGVFGFFAVGLLAAWIAQGIWSSVRLADMFEAAPEVTWFGMMFDAVPFTLVSLGLFLFWAVVGAWRLMREELQYATGPTAFILFLLTMMGYWAGYAGDTVGFAAGSVESARLYVAAFVAALLTYLTVLLDAKDGVTLRWIGARASEGRLGAALGRLPSWGWSLLAAIVMTVIVILFTDPLVLRENFDFEREFNFDGDSEILTFEGIGPVNFDSRALLLAALFFLIRDVGIVLAFSVGTPGGRGGLAAIVTLLVLYFVLPVIVSVWTLSTTWLSVFMPTVTTAPFAAAIPPLIQAVLIWLLVTSRVRIDPRPGG